MHREDAQAAMPREQEVPGPREQARAAQDQEDKGTVGRIQEGEAAVQGEEDGI